MVRQGCIASKGTGIPSCIRRKLKNLTERRVTLDGLEKDQINPCLRAKYPRCVKIVVLDCDRLAD